MVAIAPRVRFDERDGVAALLGVSLRGRHGDCRIIGLCVRLQRQSKLAIRAVAVNLLFNTTEDFETDLSNFDQLARERIAERVNLVAGEWIHDKKAFARSARQPFAITLDDGYESSLYAVEVGPKIVALLTIEDDPIFGQIVVTLLRVVESAQLDAIVKTSVETLYRDFGGSVVEAGVLVGAN